jgi:hypothetical protein
MADNQRDFDYAVWDDPVGRSNSTQSCIEDLGHGGAVVRDITVNRVCYAAAVFDMKAKAEVEAVYGLSLTLGMVLTIGMSLTMMAMDLQRMLVQPVNDVMAILKGLLVDPTSLLDGGGDEGDEAAAENPSETPGRDAAQRGR